MASSSRSSTPRSPSATAPAYSSARGRTPSFHASSKRRHTASSRRASDAAQAPVAPGSGWLIGGLLPPQTADHPQAAFDRARHAAQPAGDLLVRVALEL